MSGIAIQLVRIAFLAVLAAIAVIAFNRGHGVVVFVVAVYALARAFPYIEQQIMEWENQQMRRLAQGYALAWKACPIEVVVFLCIFGSSTGLLLSPILRSFGVNLDEFQGVLFLTAACGFNIAVMIPMIGAARLLIRSMIRRPSGT